MGTTLIKWAVSGFLSRTGIFVIFRRLLFLSIADAHNVSVRIHAGEKQWRQRAHGRKRVDVDVPSWCQIVTRILREKPPDVLYFHARNTPCLTSLDNELICQTALEALGGVSCDATPDGLPVASFPPDASSSLTVNFSVLGQDHCASLGSQMMRAARLNYEFMCKKGGKNVIQS